MKREELHQSLEYFIILIFLKKIILRVVVVMREMTMTKRIMRMARITMKLIVSPKEKI